MNRNSYWLAAALSLLAPAFVSAQTAPAPRPTATTPTVPATAVTTTEPEPTKLEAVEVTGSRIRLNAGEATALPVFTLDRIQLEELGVNRLADLRYAIPQLAPAVGFNDNLVNGGPSRGQMVSTSFNLRGLGGNSTLVLVDGLRVPHSGQEAPGGAGGREDFNVDGIPVSAIERVEILTEGAGAIYGSEAIGGVVNIILKKNYTGAEITINYDNAFDKDVGQTAISLTAGVTRGKLKTMLTASWEHQNAMMSRDRWFTAYSDTTKYGAAAPQAFFLQQPPLVGGLLASTNSPQNAAQANLPGLTTNFVAIPAGARGATLPVASYAAGVWGERMDPNQYSTSIDPAKRRNIVLNADYDYAGWLKPYLKLRWSRFENTFKSTPTTLNAQSLPVGYPGNPFSTAVFLKKTFWDMPVAQQNSFHENSGLVAGVRGNLADGWLRGWRYDATASFARNIIYDDQIAVGFNNALLTAAINNANPALRPILTYDSATPGADPNPPGYLLSLMPTFDHRDVTNVAQYTLNFDGKVWTGWAGDINAAVGGESSTEKVKFSRQPGDPSLSFALTRPVSRTTSATYVEVRVPLLSARQKIPLVHWLEVSGAVRAEHFSDLGGHNTPQYTALFQPVTWITLRTSRREGFKAPRTYDLQAPIFASTATLTTTSNVIDRQRNNELVLGVVNSITGGNPTLKPETSVSKKGGIVIDVPGSWFKGLSLSADYWQTYYVNKVGAPGRQVLIDYFPERITRGPSTGGLPGLITGFDTSNINQAGQKAKGIDYQMSYQRRFSFGVVRASAGLSDPAPVITQSTPAAIPTSTFGQLPRRTSGSLFWSRDAWNAGVSYSYQARYLISGPTGTYYPSVILFNPQVSYNFAKNQDFGDKAGAWWARALAGSKISVTIPNALEREPSNNEVLAGRIVVDPRLRRYVLSLTKKL
ncbi:MAG: hypothetical protein EXS32_06575 [Opitutus sp.]|nr:hypothetical protein [Opitutus sp.]